MQNIIGELKQVSERAYAYIQQNGDWFISNAGLILGKNYAIVVDSLTNRRMTENFLRQIRKITDKNILFLINTHEHDDHILTNYIFKELYNSVIISHKITREKTLEKIKFGKVIYADIFKEVSFEGSKYTLQDLTVEDALQIYLDDILIEIKYMGPAHTTSDIIVYLPDEKVVFCGDLLFSPPCTPFALMGYLSGYIKAIEYLISLNAEVYVPGHGDVSYGNNALYEEMKYLIFVREKAREKLREGIRDPIKASLEIDLGEYKNWISRERIVGNVARAYAELLGKPPASPIENINEIISAMLEYRQHFK